MFDEKRLLAEAQRALLDTNILIFALRGANSHPDAKLARDLFDFMVAKSVRILVAAPSLGEMNLGPSKVKFPRGAIIEVVPFDADAANWMGDHLPAKTLNEFSDPYKKAGAPGSKHFIKYDAMIVACAARAKASCIITTDENDLMKIAAKGGVVCKTPADFKPAQQSLKYPAPQPAPRIKN